MSRYKTYNTNAELRATFDELPITDKYCQLYRDFCRLSRQLDKVEAQRAELIERCQKTENEALWLKLNHVPNSVKLQNKMVNFVQWLKKRQYVTADLDIMTLKQLAQQFYESVCVEKKNN